MCGFSIFALHPHSFRLQNFWKALMRGSTTICDTHPCVFLGKRGGGQREGEGRYILISTVRLERCSLPYTPSHTHKYFPSCQVGWKKIHFQVFNCQGAPGPQACDWWRVWYVRGYLSYSKLTWICPLWVNTFPLCQFPLHQFPLHQFPLCQLPLCQFPLCQLPLCQFPFCQPGGGIDKVGIDTVTVDKVHRKKIGCFNTLDVKCQQDA